MWDRPLGSVWFSACRLPGGWRSITLNQDVWIGPNPCLGLFLVTMATAVRFGFTVIDQQVNGMRNDDSASPAVSIAGYDDRNRLVYCSEKSTFFKTNKGFL